MATWPIEEQQTSALVSSLPVRKERNSCPLLVKRLWGSKDAFEKELWRRTKKSLFIFETAERESSDVDEPSAYEAQITTSVSDAPQRSSVALF